MKLFDILFPPRCPSCRSVIEAGGAMLCPACREHFEGEMGEAVVCSLDLADGDCVLCITSGDYVSDNSRVSERLLFALKQRGDISASRFLARVAAHDISRYLAANGDDLRTYVITYAPRSEENKLKFGFDHGERLAREIARYSGAKFAKYFTRRGGDEQKSLNRAERLANADTLKIKKGAPVRGAKIIVIDDLITTGSTLVRCASLLRTCGCESVLTSAIFRRSKK